MYGSITPNIRVFSDLSYKEFFVLLPLLLLTIYLGIYPNYLLSTLLNSTLFLLEYYL